MDSETFRAHLKGYQDFIRKCPFDKGDILPIYSIDLKWSATDLVQSLTKDVPLVLEVKSTELYSQKQYFPQGNCPYFDAKWTLSLELLEVKMDSSMSANFKVPLENAKSLNDLAMQPATVSVGSASTGSSRLQAIKEGIRKRILGERAQETHRGLLETIRFNLGQSSPNCVLLAVIKAEYPASSKPIIHFTHAAIKISLHGSEMEKLVCNEPLENYALADGIYAIDSSKTAHWRDRFQRRPSIPGVRTKTEWMGLLNRVDAPDVSLHLEFQLNEDSFANIGFAFGLNGDSATFPENIFGRFKIQQSSADVTIELPGGSIIFVNRDSLSAQSAYFKSFLSKDWNTENLKFPLVAPFDSDDAIIGQVLYFIKYGVVVPSSAQNCVDLFFAAEALGMDGLRERMEVFMVPFMNQENVTQIIRLAWENKADLLLRIASLYLKANYDAIWVKDKEDLMQLGKLLSDPEYPVRFGVSLKPF